MNCELITGNIFIVAPGATYGKERPPLGNYNEKDKVYAVGHNDDRIPPEIEQMDQDDPKLVKLIQDVWLDKPSTDPTTFNHPEVLSNAMWQQDRFVDKLLKQKVCAFEFNSKISLVFPNLTASIIIIDVTLFQMINTADVSHKS